MFHNKIKHISIISAFLLLFLTYPSFAGQLSLRVIPESINAGDTVRIEFIDQHQPIKNYEIQIISPAGEVHNLVPLKQLENKGQVLFSQTYDRGFLTANWNQYEVKLYNKEKQCVDKAVFYLNDKSKQLFFTVYVDDIGRAGYLNTDGEKWFKSIGGRINYGYQHDDKGGILLGPVLKRYNNKKDYIFHHFHAWEFSGNRGILKIDRFFKWNHRKHLVNNFITIPLRDRHYIAILGLLLILSVVIWIYRKNKTTKTILISVTAIFFLMLIAVLSSHYAKDPDNWEIKLGDTAWCKNFLLTAKKEFQKNGLEYPEITRHGWNCPPRGLNKFYLTEMSVLADASVNFPLTDEKNNRYKKDVGIILNQVSQFSYDWPDEIKLPLPFYTNINDELYSVWDGIEEHRGVLQLPISNGSFTVDKFDEYQKEIISRLPNGALVSTWCHPGNDLRQLGPLLNYLTNNYKIEFVTAKKYLDIYMSYFPRPVLVDIPKGKAYWAYLSDSSMIKIRECKIFKISNNIKEIASHDLPPYLGIIDNNHTSSLIKKNYIFFKQFKNISIYKLCLSGKPAI